MNIPKCKNIKIPVIKPKKDKLNTKKKYIPRSYRNKRSKSQNKTKEYKKRVKRRRMGGEEEDKLRKTMADRPEIHCSFRKIMVRDSLRRFVDHDEFPQRSR